MERNLRLRPTIEKRVITLDAQSPEELEASINSLSTQQQDGVRFVNLNLSGSGILVSPFSLPRLSPKHLKRSLNLDAVGILSLEPHEIEVDYQHLDSSKDKISGLYAAIPKKMLLNYLFLLNRNNLIPIKLTANILSRIDCFLHKYNIDSEICCLIDFYKDAVINLSVFNKGRCQFLREIRYENIDDAKQEISHSLKYLSGKSECKEFDKVYALGDLLNRDLFLSNLEEELGKEITICEPIDMNKNSELDNSYFKINLIKRYGLPLGLLKRIVNITNLLVLIFSLVCFVLGATIVKNHVQIKKLSSSFSSLDYNKAKGLQDKIYSFKNAP